VSTGNTGTGFWADLHFELYEDPEFYTLKIKLEFFIQLSFLNNFFYFKTRESVF